MSEHIYSLEELTGHIRPLLTKYRADGAILFGSYARREAEPGSDIDLLILGGADFDPTDVFSIAEELHRATGKSVDVYELRELNEGTAFYDAVFAEGVKIA